ncbi:interleukin-15 isoform X4 [Channa argus]|uniref:interleukin-15 isoform X4 n=1 Tax=Channa argus TaxID=215402 RepID=UPI00352168EB
MRRSLVEKYREYKQRNVCSSSPPVICAERATRLSFLSISTCSASSLNTKHLQKCLTGLRQRIQKSDAELYTPPFSQICVNSSLKCYMLELKMVLNEERLEGTEVNYIFTFDKDLITTFDGCPACETYPLTNTTVFLEGLNKLLEAINA